MITFFSTEENKVILKLYKTLISGFKIPVNSEGIKTIRKAFLISYEAHKTMRRVSGEPYIYHPLEVAIICAKEIGLGVTSVVCALLHDTVEDTDLTLDDIEKNFGKAAANIINGLTKISSINEHDKSATQVENFRKMILTISDDLRVIIIKLADRLHNLRTLRHMPEVKQIKIASETLYLYAPIAHRLGLNTIKTELEDLSLKYTEASTYKFIAKKLNQKKGERESFINEFIRPIQEALKKQNLNGKVVGRPKSIYSIWNKMRNKQITFEEIYDLFAIRIILNSSIEKEKSDCWKTYSIITDFYQPNPNRLRDWISSPKSNGYESLHTTVMGPKGKWVEVQIRSKRMDEIAELGFAAHWKYKEHLTTESSLDEWVNQVSEWIKSPKESDTNNFITDFKMNLFNEEIFVFTPKGKLLKLPKNSTALDFAFSVHSDIGCKCIGAKVNYKLVPISYVLNNGDQVEILTSSKQKPKSSWLNITVTAKAHTKIKNVLKEENRIMAEEGKAILERKMKSLKLPFNHNYLHKLSVLYKTDNLQQLYINFYKGTLNVSDLKKLTTDKTQENQHPNTKVTTDKPTKIHETVSKTIILPDYGNMPYNFAPCCQPTIDNDIFGFITIHDGIKIHSVNCPNAPRLINNFSYRIIKAYWTNSNNNEKFLKLKIKGLDSIKIINDITNTITYNFKTKIHSLNMNSNDGHFELDVVIYVSNKDIFLEDLKEVLGSKQGIISIVEADDE